MRLSLRIIGGILMLLPVQGCLLYYFFAPKITPEQLPSSKELDEHKQAYIQHCAKCHLLIAPSYFKFNATIESVLDRYQNQRILNRRESQMIAHYINTVLASEN